MFAKLGAMYVPHIQLCSMYLGSYYSYFMGTISKRIIPGLYIVKVDTVLYTNIWKIDTLPDDTSLYPKCM